MIYRMLELCCGTGNVSRAFMELGWQAEGVDIEDHGYPGKLIKQDVRDFPPIEEKYSFIWASPPCSEFSNAKYYAYGTCIEYLGLDLVQQCQHIIQSCKPRFWIMENVKRLEQFIGPAVQNIPYTYYPGGKRAFLWGNYPQLSVDIRDNKRRHDNYGNSDVRRGAIPMPLAKEIAKVISYHI